MKTSKNNTLQQQDKDKKEPRFIFRKSKPKKRLDKEQR